MAATIARATGVDSTGEKTAHRLGSQCARVEAATWRTFACATVYRDGSGLVTVRQNGAVIHEFGWGPEPGGAR